jgi:UDP-2-acetamido-3-amino-2,3-dideoxy-glucuronate N-acetyltransferase
LSEIHPLADVRSTCVGEGTRIWQYSVVLEGAVIGRNCNVCAHTLIEGNVIIGDNVTVKSGVYLWDGVRVEDNVFIGPNATFTNDLLPRSKVYPGSFLGIYIERGASIGANATLLPGIRIGAEAMIGAGAVVTKSVPARAVIIGNPGRVIRYLE